MISYFIKERFPRKTQAAYKILLNTQNRTCKVLFYLRKTRNVVLNYDMGEICKTVTWKERFNF